MCERERQTEREKERVCVDVLVVDSFGHQGVYKCVHVCVCVRGRERARKTETGSMCLGACT